MTGQQKPKRRHHTVWQRYLKPWTKRGSIWCRQDGQFFSANTVNIAVEKDFYKLEDLTERDIFVVKLLFAKSPEHVRKSLAQLLQMTLTPFQLAAVVPDHARAAYLATVADYAAQALEDYHMHVEAEGAPLLDLALRGDLSFYEDDRCIPFLYFLSMQHMRTKGIKERSLALNGANHAFDLTRPWNLLVIMFAETIALSLYLERKRRTLILIENGTDVPFITGDQPLFNLLAPPPRAKPPEQLSIFYPISPTQALLLTEENAEPMFPAKGLSREQATTLNERLAETCFRQVFAQTEASLRALPI